MASGRGTGSIYYGWYIMAISMLALMITTGATMNAFGLYVLPASQDFHLSRATMNTGLILMNAGSAVASLVLGQLVDRYPARLIMAVGGAALASSLVGLGLSHNLWLSALLLTVPMGVGMAGTGNLTSPALVARWFTARRGRALAITMMGMSIATIVAAPPVAWLIDRFGWRQSLIVLGAIVAVVIALLLPWVRNAPGPDEHETTGVGEAPAAMAGVETGGAPLGPRQLLAIPQFWALVLGTALAMALFQGLLVSLIPIGREAGFSTTKAASLISSMGLAAIITKLVVAWLADRLDRAFALACLYAMLGAASAEMLFAHTYPTLVLATVLLGIAAGATMPLAMALLADRFGAQSFGSASGVLTFTISVISAVSVRYAGEVYDRTGGYDLLFYSFIAVGLLSGCLMLAVRGGTARSMLVPAE